MRGICVGIKCPACGRQTVVAVATPDARIDKKVSRSFCRNCGAVLIFQTFSDGSLQIQPANGEPEELEIPSPFALSDVVRILPSIWQPRRDMVEQFDHRPEWVTELDKALREKQSNPRPLSVPRRIFISYRWSTPEQDAWVARLADRLVARGNFVVFDRHVQREPAPLSVPELVSRIADCHFTLVVLDSNYIKRITARSRKESPEGWVWDEFQTALAFADAGLNKIIGFLRDDTPLPAWFVPFQPHRAGNTFDVRNERAVEQVVDRFFAQSGGIPDPAWAREAARLLHDSMVAERHGDVAAADTLALNAAKLVPEVPDGNARRARTAYVCHEFADALAAARTALDLEPGNDEALLYGAAAAADLGHWEDCMQLARVALDRDAANYNAHFSLGKGLSARNQIEPAIAHLNIARTGLAHGAQIHAAAAEAYRKIGRPGEAVECLQTALRHAAAARHEPLLLNLAAASIEAGNARSAREAIANLSARFPRNNAIGVLKEVLGSWEASRGPPPNLMGGVLPVGKLGLVSCDECDASIHYSNPSDCLCAGCGAVRSLKEPMPCRYCAAPRRVCRTNGFIGNPGGQRVLCLSLLSHGTSRLELIRNPVDQIRPSFRGAPRARARSVSRPRRSAGNSMSNRNNYEPVQPRMVLPRLTTARSDHLPDASYG